MDKLEFDIFNKFKDKLSCYVFSRHGGVSKEPFDSLNIRYGIGDDNLFVKQNRQKICNFLGIKYDHLISLNQVHSDQILIVENPYDHEIDGYDAMITNKKGLYLMIQVADCQAVCIYDPVNELIANIHSGWKGSAQEIVSKTISMMKGKYDSDPENLLIGISPSLGPCHSEFSDPYNELPQHLHKYIDNNNRVDLWKATFDECIQAGILENKIEAIKKCTVDHMDKYFSYRGEKQKTGRFGVVIGLT